MKAKRGGIPLNPEDEEEEQKKQEPEEY